MCHGLVTSVSQTGVHKPLVVLEGIAGVRELIYFAVCSIHIYGTLKKLNGKEMLQV